MPVSLQIERLERELKRDGGGNASVLLVDFDDLEGSERDAAFDAVVTGAPSPFVIVDGRLVCSGAIDIPAIIATLD